MQLVKSIFGKDGLAEATEQIVFDCRLQLVRQTNRQVPPRFERHFERNILPFFRGTSLLPKHMDFNYPVGPGPTTIVKVSNML